MTKNTNELVPACAYQGGKGRLASDIADTISLSKDSHLYDLCCGSGALAIEMVNRGHRPENITMVDNGPWGKFWQSIGDGTFDMLRFAVYCSLFPTDPAEISDHLIKLSKNPCDVDTAYIFILLQAGSFGSKAVYIKDNKWVFSPRLYWLPTETSSRRYPVNPMMPMPNTLYERVSVISENMYGVIGLCADVADIKPEHDSVVYIDPPYQGTATYGSTLDVVSYAQSLDATVYVSEGKALNDSAVCLSQGRSKGGMNGKRKTPNQEWLNVFKKQSLDNLGVF